MKSQMKPLKGLKATLWIFWGDRSYARNKRDSLAIVEGMSLLFLAALSLVFYWYFPFRFFGFIVFVGTTLMMLFYPIHLANRTMLLGMLYTIAGALGLLLKIHFGLTVLWISIERFVFWGFLMSGILTLYRRAWNYCIWKCLDSIASATSVSESIDMEAYDAH